MSAYLAQARTELRLGLRNGEQLLVNLIIPLLVLVFFTLVEVVPVPEGTSERVDFLAPGVLALAIMSTSMVSLGIGTGFERQYGVLKRLGATPLGRGRWLAAKVTAVLATIMVQLAVLVPVAVVLGWRPDGPLWPFVPAVLAGTAAFAGIGLLMAGSLRGTTTLALANGLYLVLLLLGGMVFPLGELPAALETVARILPAAALTSVVTAAFDGGATDAGAWIVLLVWAVAAPALAAWRFRWE
jgi:ABC-2 type transport system permease protein